MSVEQMRKVLMDKYQGEAWKQKVREMSDNKVIAVYYNFLRKGK